MLISAKLAPNFPYSSMESFWKSADKFGFHGVWNYDHFYGAMDPSDDCLEGWTTLAAMGVIVKRARIGCMVTGVTYRHPAVLANMAATVDQISGGRMDFGIGAAWHQGEHDGYGIELPAPATRVAMLDEALTLIKLLWTEDRPSFEGRFYRLKEAICLPKPLQKPFPPIVVGALGPKTLLVTAKHANEWNAVADPEEWARLNKILDKQCEAVGRDPSEIRRSAQMTLFPGQKKVFEETLARIPEYEAAGCQHAVLSFYGSPPKPAQLKRLAPA